MAQQCGKKADSSPEENNGDAPVTAPADSDPVREPITGRFVRYAGLVLLCGVGMGILAAVVLLPPYAELLRTRHNKECEALRLKEAERTIAAMDRYGEDVVSDPLLTRRQAWNTMGLKSENDVIVKSQNPDEKKTAPLTLSPIKYQDPPLPNPRIMHLAGKVQQPKTQRGMIMLGVLMVITSLLLFAPLRQHRRR
ncbi:MAG: hypothetical protein KAR11_07080 [Phycisphaerae bacterium]|nr:hypothetical protein [Phycisphaerae bacterium]